MPAETKLMQLPSWLVLGILVILGPSSVMAEGHWAYEPLGRPDLPQVERSDWCRNPIDRFTLRRMEEVGLVPQPEASTRRLARRLHLDLIGLPPSRDQLESCASEQGIERLADELFLNPAYGEHMATAWLDLARYADTHGYHMDAHREMWQWRDWVVSALNAGMSFDRFTGEQLAGDLLPEPTLSQQIASGFNRNHMINFEDGALPEEFRTEYIIDRVVTTSTIWLGTTMICCRCHDHKYDSFTQRDFYRLYAFFDRVPEQGVDGDKGNAGPVIQAPSAEQRQQQAHWIRRRALLQNQLKERGVKVEQAIAAWEQEMQAEVATLPATPEPVHAVTLDGEVTAPWELRNENPIWVPGKYGRALLCGGDSRLSLSGQPAWTEKTPFSFSAWVFPTTRSQMVLFSRDKRDSSGSRLSLELHGGSVQVRVEHANRSLLIAFAAPVQLRRWQQLLFSCDGYARPEDMTVFLDGKPYPGEIISESLQKAPQLDGDLVVGEVEGQGFRGLLDEFRLYDFALNETQAAQLSGQNPIVAILRVPRAERSAQQTQSLRAYYLDTIDVPWRQLSCELAEVDRSLEQLNLQIPTVMVMRDGARTRPTRIFENGRYDSEGEVVTAGTPKILPELDDRAPRNRLGLAEWLTGPAAGLTSRVTVNRIWSRFFGRGLVSTPEDFGVRGQRPSHPDLLEWLAYEFVLSGWDVRHIQRLIVQSATYRQDSNTSEAAQELDPENVWLSHTPRLRLTAEAIRDQALAAADLLEQQSGGPGVFPYQPDGLWRAVSYDPDSFTAQIYIRSQGRDLYRRSLYTFRKRSVPPPTFQIFDAPTREVCTAERARTTTPQQALVLMNDPTFVEAARSLANQMLRQFPAASLRVRLNYLYERLLSRSASDAEFELFAQLIREESDMFRARPKQVRDLLGPGEYLAPVELAAWTIAASVLLQTDEAVVRP